MSRLELLSCAGVPSAGMRQDKTEILTYEIVNGVQATATAGEFNRFYQAGSGINQFGVSGGISNAFTKACKAIFVLENGHIAKVNYIGRGEGLLVPNSQCEPIIRNCIK